MWIRAIWLSWATAAGMSVALSVGAAEPPAASEPTAPTQSSKPSPERDLFDLDLEQLGSIPVRPKSNPSGTGVTVTPSTTDASALGSIGELLEPAPGVSVRRTSAFNLDPRVRGFHSGQLNASANGMTQLKTRIDIDSLFSQIDPRNVRELSVIDGPYTSLHGPGFAFLDAALYSPGRYPGGVEGHAWTTFAHESNGRRLHVHERLWGGGEAWGFNLAYGFSTGNDYRPGSDSLDFLIPASYHKQDIYLAVGCDLSCQSRVEFNYLHQDLWDVELPGVAYDINRSRTEQFNVRYVVQEDPAGVENFVLQFWTQYTPFRGDNRRESKFRTFNRLLLGKPFPGLEDGFLVNDGRIRSYGGRALASWGEKDSLTLTVGVDWRRYSQLYRERDFLADGAPEFLGNVYGIPRSSQDDYGVLVQAGAAITDRLRLTAGGRFDLITNSLDRSDPVVAAIAEDYYFSYFRPGLNAPTDALGMGYLTGEYRLTERLTLTCGVAYAMRAPNLAELYSDEPFVPVGRFGNSFTDGSSDLKPEHNLQFDLGLIARGAVLEGGVRTFHCHLRDYILAVPADFSTLVRAGVATPENLGRDQTAFAVDPADPEFNLRADTASLNYKYANIRRATLYGGEVFGEARLLPWLAVNATIAYVKGTNHAPVRYLDVTGTFAAVKDAEALPNIYPLNGSMGLRVFEPQEQRWSVECVARMVHSQNYVADSLAELPTPGFTVFSVYGFYQFSRNLQLFTAIENLFDRSYQEHGSLAIINRNGQIGFVKEPGFSWLVGIQAKY